MPRRITQPSLLVLQVDTDRIERDGLDLSEVATWAGNASALVTSTRVRVSKTTTFAQFQETVQGHASMGRFDVVVIIAHSNATGVAVASDRFLTWEELGEELKVLKPRRLVLIACKGGRASGANGLFRKLRDLRRIYACPVNATKDLGVLMMSLVPFVVEVKAPREETVRQLQALSGISVGGQLRHWMRDHDKDNPSGQLLDVLSDLVDPYVRQIPRALMSRLGLR